MDGFHKAILDFDQMEHFRIGSLSSNWICNNTREDCVFCKFFVLLTERLHTLQSSSDTRDNCPCGN